MRWKLLLLIMASIIVIVSLWYTNRLAKTIAEGERKKVELWANATKFVVSADYDADLTLAGEVLRSNTTVPVILTNQKGEIIEYRNLKKSEGLDSAYLYRRLEEMKSVNERIEIAITDDISNYIYYDDSYLLTRLKYYPLFQFAIIALFLLVAYVAFSNSRKAEQNQVWVGMAKETAHQLGTPISSLVAWIEYLKSQLDGNSKAGETIQEMNNDVKRLELITDRFSKIGSEPTLTDVNILSEINYSVNYMKRRSSDQVKFSVKTTDKNIKVKISPPLFNWVIENLLKNALDAMNGEGRIDIAISTSGKQALIDIKDSGKGIARSNFKTVFNPGYSTKKRGWGLGLSLCKRIIEQYHFGKIFVKDSIVGKYTIFRIVLS